MNPSEPHVGRRARHRLHAIYFGFALCFVLFVLGMGLLERLGMPRQYIGFVFLAAPVVVYAVIGVVCRTTDPAEYYVAGRRVPAVYNGMATAADWMSAASFIGLAGTLYLTGFEGLAYVLGWTGGFCLVALLMAPYLRKFGQYTIPDFLGARYQGHLPRLIGVAAAVLCSFVYVVAQIYGVGLITTRLTHIASFEIGVFLGLGGILVCSFLGGMRAVTWTQVAQYIVLLLAYLVPVVWLSVKQTGVPFPQAVYGQQLQKVAEAEARLKSDPAELSAIQAFHARANELGDKQLHATEALASERAEARQRIAALQKADAPQYQVQAAEREMAALPKDEASAIVGWRAEREALEARARPLAGMPDHAAQFAGDPDGTPEQQHAFEASRRNFLALVFCLMLGTAGLPHILTRSYTTPSVREARQSVAWSLFFILLLYLTAPALAVMVKFEIFTHLVGTSFDALPAWIANWNRVDPGLLSVVDINHDRVLQLAELKIGGDIIMLATPEIAGLPYVISGMVAAGGLAAALSTADGLLLTISNALSHDLYHKVLDPQAGTARRVMLSKLLLLVVALAAASVAAQKPANILFLVSAAFSLAASAFFPALVLGFFWRRANRWGASAGMLAGLVLCFGYMAATHPWLRGLFGITAPAGLWWDIQPISAGVFGVPFGFLVTIVVSLLTPPPPPEVRQWVEDLRHPG
ncbi:VC_2705 family sodium/solute symporter [Ideonella azotifigens]|uniref:Cation acetate symporter n=3 Tax=Ideonella azotifigens TaxID=513160 RepID=A0ABN1JZP8_9BURK|nr:VC_2705 family sodium/solute symporter [Ideonella azotifigens]MCD2342634.1 VC_2705 family sodium/solute symporter [Ideonella azotifigens]